MDGGEERIVREEKIASGIFDEALMLIARSITHELNNALMGIGGRAELIRGDLEKDSPFERHLKGIEDYVDRSSILVLQLRRCWRQDPGLSETEPADINDIVKRCIRILERTDRGIKIDFAPGSDLMTVCADPFAILKVLLAVSLDIACLVPRGSCVRIETAYLDPKSISGGADQYVGVFFQGVCLQERVIDEIREGAGETKGIVFQALLSDQGVESFVVAFPSRQGFFQTEGMVSFHQSHRGKTLLVVDDEDMVREVGAGMIKRLGYDVLTAGSGREAVEVFELEHDRLDLVLVDVMMEGMDGIETAERMRSIDPEVPLVLSSGYRDGVDTRAMKRLGCRLLQKPFSMDELGVCIREALGEA